MVCELEGPTPILKISNTDMASCGKTDDLKTKIQLKTPAQRPGLSKSR
jgi:hypothetical protein